MKYRPFGRVAAPADLVCLLCDDLVVTGATDGIGQAFAVDLYRKGWNVLIVSRTQAKLDEVIKKDLSTLLELLVIMLFF